MKDYIKESSLNKKEWLLHSRIPFIIINNFPNHIKVKTIINILENTLSSNFFLNIESIYIGNFEELKRRDVKALFINNSIYLDSMKDEENTITENIIVKDIIHEVAHSLEELYSDDLYFDHKLENEFLSKRLRLFSMLRDQGYKIDKDVFLNPEFNMKFDYFLHKVVGYDKLKFMTIGLFINPYSATSLSEYFASGFEEYHMGNDKATKEISRILYRKVKDISDAIGDYNNA